MSVNLATKSGFDTEFYLPKASAIALATLIERSENWFLAPFNDGVFKNLREAKNYINKNNNEPLLIVATMQNSDNVQSLLITFNEGKFYLTDYCMQGALGVADSVNEIIPVATRLFKRVSC